MLALRDVTSQHAIEKRLMQLAYFDGLTNLANRRLFRRHLMRDFENARRGGRELALCYVDIDHFKEVNDSLGHAGGDQLLLSIAVRLRRSLASYDVRIARLGGDEFALLFRDATDTASLRSALTRVEQTVSQPMKIEGQVWTNTLSIGVARFPGDARSPDELARHADEALYRAKRNGRTSRSSSSRSGSSRSAGATASKSGCTVRSARTACRCTCSRKSS